MISVGTGGIERTLAYRAPPAGAAPAMAVSLALTRAGSRLFAIPREFGEIIVYDTRSWAIVQTQIIDDRGRSPYYSSIAIDEEHDALFIAERNNVQIREYPLSAICESEAMSKAELRESHWRSLHERMIPGTGEELRRFDAFQVRVNAMGVNPRTHELVVGGDGALEGRRDPQTGEMRQFADDPNTLVRAYDPVTGQQTRTYVGPGGNVEGLSISSDGALIGASKARQLSKRAPCYILIWNVDDGKLLDGKDCGRGFVRDIAFGPQAKLSPMLWKAPSILSL